MLDEGHSWTLSAVLHLFWRTNITSKHRVFYSILNKIKSSHSPSTQSLVHFQQSLPASTLHQNQLLPPLPSRSSHSVAITKTWKPLWWCLLLWADSGKQLREKGWHEAQPGLSEAWGTSHNTVQWKGYRTESEKQDI